MMLIFGLLLICFLDLHLLCCLNPQQYYSTYAWIYFVIGWNFGFLVFMSWPPIYRFHIVGWLWFFFYIATHNSANQHINVLSLFLIQFIFWFRCSIATVWGKNSRIDPAVAYALFRFTYLWKTCLWFFLCCYLFLLFTLVWFIEFLLFWGLALYFSSSWIKVSMIFIMSAAYIISLGYLLLFICYWLGSSFSKLSYFDWS